MTNTELFAFLKENNFTLAEYESMQKQLAYRAEYNARPEVREKRRAYTAKRNARMRILKSLLTERVGQEV